VGQDANPWVVCEPIFRTGATALVRTRVRPTAGGWKFVVTPHALLVQEKFDDATVQRHEVRWQVVK
jgi:hypothetical protein